MTDGEFLYAIIAAFTYAIIVAVAIRGHVAGWADEDCCFVQYAVGTVVAIAWPIGLPLLVVWAICLAFSKDGLQI